MIIRLFLHLPPPQPGGHDIGRPPRTCACTWWHGLAGVPTGVEDHTVSGFGDAFSHCHLMGLGRDLGEQALVGGDGGQVAMVIARNHQHMNRRLRIYVAECERARAFEHDA